MQIDRSPLARPFPALPPIAGVTLRVARARYKTWDRCDLTFAELAATNRTRCHIHFKLKDGPRFRRTDVLHLSGGPP